MIRRPDPSHQEGTLTPIGVGTSGRRYQRTKPKGSHEREKPTPTPTSEQERERTLVLESQTPKRTRTSIYQVWSEVHMCTGNPTLDRVVEGEVKEGRDSGNKAGRSEDTDFDPSPNLHYCHPPDLSDSMTRDLKNSYC